MGLSGGASGGKCGVVGGATGGSDNDEDGGDGDDGSEDGGEGGVRGGEVVGIGYSGLVLAGAVCEPNFTEETHRIKLALLPDAPRTPAAAAAPFCGKGVNMQKKLKRNGESQEGAVTSFGRGPFALGAWRRASKEKLGPGRAHAALRCGLGSEYAHRRGRTHGRQGSHGGEPASSGLRARPR